MRKLSLPVMAFTLLCVTVSMSQRRSESPTTASPDRRWAYGIYQVNQSKYTYEWLDNDRHIHAPNRQAFFEKLGIANALIKTNQRYIQTSRPFPDYIVDLVVLNHFGEQGWELVESSERIFKFKRQKIR